MNIMDTRAYQWLETATDFFLLNVLWLLACVPVVTVFPSTAAMFGVARAWTRGKETGVFGAFVLRLRLNLRQRLVVGAVEAQDGVVRDGTRGNETGVCGAFVLRFRQNLRQSLAVGMLWTLLGGVLFLDFLIAGGMPPGLQAAMGVGLVRAG